MLGGVVGSPAGLPGTSIGAVLGAQLTDKLVAAMRSPRFKSTSAHRLNQLAEAVAIGNKGLVAITVARITAGTSSQAGR
jgi:hypothetical protein